MPLPHIVNPDDGLSSLWLIARHYRVSIETLKARNPHIMNRHSRSHPRHGWLQIGDRIFLPESQVGGRAPRSGQAVGAPRSEAPWRAFLFALADEILPSGKVIRKVLEFPGPSFADQMLAHPEQFGMRPPDPLSPLSIGEHALGNNHSRFLSASTRPGGAPNFHGRPVFIDIKKAVKAGVRIYTPEEIVADLERLVRENPSLKPRVDRLKYAILHVEREVLLEGNIPRQAIKSQGAMMATRGLRIIQVIGVAFTVYDLGKASAQSYQQQSIKPITAETIRQVGGWAGAVAGMKVGFAAGAVLGIETGPGAIITGGVGALVFGAAGYAGADWIADFISEN